MDVDVARGTRWSVFDACTRTAYPGSVSFSFGFRWMHGVGLLYMDARQVALYLVFPRSRR